ncbi:MAG: putative selenium-dependent hydroxylase accessory protein YqeC [Chloroflexi bacterium]|nr:putative selenium-dependent hydroxylase accessory protein YqeC [Candidatus Rokubacteria bacterium]MBI2325002.1 putative selenium-dependent hydroxylase accessory protein YqeC [Chloroflexota bacterium]
MRDGGLREALTIGEREVVAFVGAGGKTTAMFRVARELRAAGAAVVVTTTTKILVPPPSTDLEVITEADDHDALSAVRTALASGHVPVVAHAVIPGDKLGGIGADRVAELAAIHEVTHVLVEADGAARRSFKAPRADEPVIPASATIVVPVVGIDALGEPLSERVAHRPEEVAALTGLAPGDRLTASAIARVMLGAGGNTRGAPHGARIVPLVNKVDTPERVAAAHDLAAELRRCGAERVVIAALEAERPIVEIWSSR